MSARINLDPTLAFTAILELRPGLPGPRAAELRVALGDAMTAANPRDRWSFARDWLDEHEPIGGAS
jgi:hypothetical protein